MPMENYDDYELQNAQLAAQSARGVVPISAMVRRPEPSYDDYELGNARIARSIASMAQRGRGSDTMVAHVTPGDVVVPRFIAEKDPSILQRVKKNFEEEGADYRDHIVGSEFNNINPKTGAPEFGFFSNFFKPKNLIRTAATIGGFAVGGPAGAAAGAGLSTKLTGGSTQESLLNAGGAYLGSNYLGSGTGDVAGNLTQYGATRGIGTSLAGTALGGASVSGLSGALTGQSLAEQLSKATMVPTGEVGGFASSIGRGENLDISRPENMELPGSLGNLSGLSDIQRTSQIATQGVEGQGSSKEGQDYFYNQIRRRLTDENSTADEVIPIEQNYLQRMGVAYQPGNVKSILEGIARKQAAA